ncbi:rod-binding protein [Shumkonia mesophila]|uniref:rod-binding protein n=1 Tax=Shumkonia mesophila TaxID=2838854 RepID=UPI00293501DC|nr:rod-binding protein [Shumkonia mesophila]
MADTILALQAENAMAAGSRTPTPGRGMNLAKAREAAQDFEAFFLGQMLQPMFADLEAEEPFGGGEAESMWRSLQVDEYGKAFARKGGVGIADMVVREMIKMQEGK